MASLVGLGSPQAASASGVGLDGSFSNNGRYTLADRYEVNSTEVAAPGDVYLGGLLSRQAAPFILKLSNRGNLASDYGADGLAELPPAVAGSVRSIALAPSGNLIAAIDDARAPPSFAHVVALRPDGKLDTTFGSDGSLSLEGPDAGPLDVAGSGEIYLLTGPVVRLRPDGEVDASFSADPLVEETFDDLKFIEANPAGQVVLGGSIEGDAALARLRDDGSLDPTFGDGGVMMVTSLGIIGGSSLLDLAVRDDGSLLASYEACVTSGPSPCSSRVVGFSDAGEAIVQALTVAHQIVPLPNDLAAFGGLRYGENELPAGVSVSFASQKLSVSGSSLAYPGPRDSYLDDLDADAEGRIIATAHEHWRRSDRGPSLEGPFTVYRFGQAVSVKDRDLDQHPDRRDRCIYLPARGHGGCPAPRRRLVVKTTKTGLGGRLEAETPGCRNGAPIEVLELPRSANSGTARVVAGSAAYESRWGAPSLEPGRYRVRAPSFYGAGGSGYCRAVQTAPIRIRR